MGCLAPDGGRCRPPFACIPSARAGACSPGCAGTAGAEHGRKNGELCLAGRITDHDLLGLPPPTGARCYVCGPEPGLTARCPDAAAVALRVVARSAYLWIQLGGGAGAFRFTLPSVAPGVGRPSGRSPGSPA
ncbi:DUF6510 family protein [Streptomyces cyaneofuscatus]|uniref:DUF6510 family protein n=1 Tax=Streptomyces cyaneofuscatus TaxID=66883 RepID=UPI0036B5731E